jgi:SAM-dependent methyltransferase
VPAIDSRQAGTLRPNLLRRLFENERLPYPCAVADFERETERIRRIYDRGSDITPSGKNGALAWIGAQVEGETLEIGIGRGRSLPYYPPGTKLSGIDLSGVAIQMAAARAAELSMDADIRQGDATRLPYASDHFDTVVFCFVLCTIPDDVAAVAEAVRVLKPGGRLVLLEHVRSPNPFVQAVEKVFEPLTMWRMGDHLLREPLYLILAEDLEVLTLERRTFGIVERLVARKPNAAAPEQAG